MFHSILLLLLLYLLFYVAAQWYFDGEKLNIIWMISILQTSLHRWEDQWTFCSGHSALADVVDRFSQGLRPFSRELVDMSSRTATFILSPQGWRVRMEARCESKGNPLYRCLMQGCRPFVGKSDQLVSTIVPTRSLTSRRWHVAQIHERSTCHHSELLFLLRCGGSTSTFLLPSPAFYRSF